MFGIKSIRWAIIAASIAAAPLGAMLPADFTPDAPTVTADVVMVSESTDDDGPAMLVTSSVEWLTLDVEEDSIAPSDLVTALQNDRAVWADPNDGAERLYAPVGTWFDVPGGGYLATVDGWWSCTDHVTAPEVGTGECSGPDGPVEPVAGLSWGFDGID